MKEKILFMTNLLPYPLDNGGKIKTYNTLSILSKIFDVDLFCFIEEKSDRQYIGDIQKLGISVNCVLKRLRHTQTPFLLCWEGLKSLITKYPYVVSKYASPEMRRIVAAKLAQKQYHTIYVDHLQLFQYVPSDIYKTDISVLLDQHNLEYEIIQRRIRFTKNVFKKLFLRLEYLKAVRYEKECCMKADLILAITKRDLSLINKMTQDRGRCRIAPFYVKEMSPVLHDHSFKKKTILFLGTMSWFPNEDAVIWFFNNVFKQYHLDNQGWRFLIVGNSPGKAVLDLKSDSVNITGYVDNLRPYLDESLLSVVPLRIGGGMRIKILDLFSFGIPVISTNIGCEGIPVSNGEHILIADTPLEFKRSIERIYHDSALRQNLVNNALSFVKTHYSSASALEQYRDILRIGHRS
jgi:glycosyltransferase involved in cell wall biosynthesis